MGVHIIAYGEVQGMGFRYFIENNANSLNIKGFVSNNSDGTVEAHFSGDEKAITKMISLCRKGPLFARVTKIEIRECDEKFNDFKIR